MSRILRFPAGRRGLICIVLLCIGIALLPAQTGGGRRGAGASPSDGSTGARTTTAIVSERAHSITVAGRLQPQARIVHRIPTAGFVDSISVREGDSVATGDTLLRVRRRDDVLELYQPVPLPARISGRVSVVHVSTHGEVSTGDDAVTILDTRAYRLSANISDKDAFRIDVGRAVTGMTTEHEAIPGQLIARSQEPDYGTGLFELTFRFSALPGVRIGEFITIDLPTDSTEGIFISRDAVTRRYGSYYVWVVTEDGTLTAREVTPGELYGDDYHITAGIRPGETYLARPTGREREGMTVSTEAGTAAR